MGAERVDRRIARLAERQGGKVSRAQLRALGLKDAAIGRRIERGLLHRDHRGVLAVGHVRVDELARWWGALLACPGSVLSHASAAAAWDLLPVGGGAVHITVPTSGGRARRRGVVVHRKRLEPGEIVCHEGLPVTGVERTLLDLAVVARPPTLARAVERAEWLRILDAGRVPDARPGSARLRAALAAPLTLTRSELERAFLALCDRHGIERPRTNVVVRGFEVDFWWPAAGLVVETDGAEFHLTRQAFEADRRRDQALTAAGLTVVRFTHRQVVHEGPATAGRLTELGAPRRGAEVGAPRAQGRPTSAPASGR
jgi:very-short-patch-repair endonuclease